MDVSDQDKAELESLEEGLWRAEVRFDLQRMEDILAPDFFEFGRSGRVYQRQETLAIPAQPIAARLPLPDFRVRLLDANVAQVTYTSAVRHEGVELLAHRSSIWSRTERGWQLRFHQGTPIPGETG